MNQLVFKSNDQVITSSRNIARDFGKEHKNVLRDIRALLKIEPAKEMFFESTYVHESNNQEFTQFLMNRDGFTLLVMGFTGRKAMNFKLKYINAFNHMEKQIEQQKPKSKLEILQESINQLVEQEKRLTQLEQRQDNITNIIRLNNNGDWRDKTNKIINTIARKNGGTYQQTRKESYARLETRARCDLQRRLENKIERMKSQGVQKRTINNLNYLDVIDDDDRLIEIYLAIVKEMAVEHGINYKVVS